MQKRIVILAVGASLAMPAVQAAGLSLDQLVACAAITESSARLACYDREVAPLARQVAAPGPSSASRQPAAPTPVPAASTAPLPVPGPTVSATPIARGPAAPAAPATPAPSFGDEQLSRERRPAAAAEEQVLHAHLTSQSPAGGGLFNLYLDNGQVWRHQDQMLGPYLRDGEAITIEKGALGSYRLTRDAGKSRNWIRVTRVR